MPLLEAIKCGATEDKILQLLDSGIDIYKEDVNGYTVLMFVTRWARRKHFEKFVKILLENGMNANAMSKFNGYTPLLLAASDTGRHSTEKTVKMLIVYGARVDMDDDLGMTSLIGAARYSGIDSTENTVKILLEANADVTKRNCRRRTALCYAVEHICYYRKACRTTCVITMLIENTF
jgi:ankyrin repeat protein